MSVSERFQRLVRGAPWLWIETPTRAAAAAVAAIAAFSLVVAFEWSQPWRLLAAARPAPHAAPDTRLLSALAWTDVTPVDTVILVGGSSAREFPASDSHLSRVLSARCGRPIRFINGGTSSQTFAESWAIAEAVRDDRRRLVVVGMNYSRFEEGAAEVSRDLRTPLLPLRQPATLKRAVADVGGSSPMGAGPGLTQSSWLLHRLDEVTFQDAPESFRAFIARSDGASPWQGPDNVYRAPPLDAERKADIVRRMQAEQLPLYAARRGEALALWLAFLRRFDRPGSEVLLLALPESASMAPLNARAGAAFPADLAVLERHGGRVADWRTSHGLAEADFYDQQHLLESGRRKIEPRFVELLTSALPACSP